MKKITIDMYETRFPKNNSLYFNNLTDNEKKEYLNLYSTYSHYLILYLTEKLDLKKYDTRIINSTNKFKIINYDKMDLYQYLSSDYLSYLYIRNNIYIERLTNDEKKYLNSLSNSNDLNLTEEISNFISKTCLKVILEEPDLNKNLITNYGPSEEQFAQTNAIIIGLRYDRFYLENDVIQKDWNRQDDLRQLEFDFITKYMKNSFKKITSLNVVPIIYNDSSVKPLVVKSENNSKNLIDRK